MDREKLREISGKYAEKQGFRLNPDRKKVDWVLKALLEIEKKHGFRYCPCRAITGDKKEDAKSICPCVYHKDEIAKQGYCKCKLFVK